MKPVPRISTSLFSFHDDPYYLAVLVTPIRIGTLEIRYARATAPTRFAALFRIADLIQQATETCYHVDADDGCVRVTTRGIGPPIELVLGLD
ncbi:hypothetical protein A2368_04140 [Candidatus Collierbacteria bacterium RIFOXYB1_FULL_49_13]|uniref:Uncharacterized protein n=1 Tax=Candidatus Collierbacteria bacterium RIFOXYB1_FULL_49_13 TaxID=1817728 RepID=A0A1F5FHA7_9BACT|nr:MAG: hypothetical protein A2368_04140 [Candidatus Collierbacteria bacterium RIFOXYB1_FULL_49_13]